MQKLELKLNPVLNPEELALEYQKDNAIRIANIFPTKTAETIYEILTKNTPWHIVHADKDGKHVCYRQEAWQALGAQRQREIYRQVSEQARDGFSYLYLCYQMIDNYIAGNDPDWPLHALTEFVNSDEFRDFVKIVTNEPSVIKLDAQAAMYQAGHFLNSHDDKGEDSERRAAYVLNFSKNWRPDWGGQFLFLDEDDNPEKGFCPTFNSLTMFKVPRRHIVSQVASFAGGPRLTIVGWLRDDPK